MYSRTDDNNTLTPHYSNSPNSGMTSGLDSRRLSRSSPLVGERNKLCQEITDEFLVCKICMDRLTAPKCLGCLHTFCEACIEKHVLAEYANKKYGDYREFHCPLCRKKTTLPIGGVRKLPDNFLVCSLSDMVTRSKKVGSGECDICPSQRKNDAVSKCLECHKLLCSSCVELHRTTRVTRGHALIDVDSEKDVFCKEHEEEVVRFYCEPCQLCVCVVCTFNTHREHEVSSFGESALRHKQQITRLLSDCKKRANELEACLDSLGRVEKDIKATEQQVRDLAIEFVSEVRQRERQLVEELRSSYGEEALDFLSKRSEYQVLLDSLRSSCSLSEVVVRGKDLNFLLLKKSIQDKLRQSEKIHPLLEIPAGLVKQVRFVPGGFELGWLQEDGETRKTKYPSRRCSFSRCLKFVGSMDTREATSQTIDTSMPFSNKLCQTESNSFEQSIGIQTLHPSCQDHQTQTKTSYLQDKSVNTTIRMVQSAKVTKVLTAVPVTNTDVCDVVSVAVATLPPRIEGPKESPPANGSETAERKSKSPPPKVEEATPIEEPAPKSAEEKRSHKHHHKHHHHHHHHHKHHQHHQHNHRPHKSQRPPDCHHKQRKEARMATLEESVE